MSTSNLVVSTGKPFQGWLTGRQNKRANRNQKQLIRKQSAAPVTVGKLHANNQSFPNGSILLGQCKDGLPFLLDMSDPASGPILISGDQACGKTHQLQVLVESAVRIYKPSELQLSILTHNPTDWEYLVDNRAYNKCLQDVHAWYEGRAEGKIKALTDLAEKRRDDQVNGPKVVFILDDLNFVEDLSFEAQANLRWLIAYGAQSGVWIIAAVKSRYAKSLTYWLEPFRTRILGKISSMNQTRMLAISNEPQKRIMEPSEFRVWTGSNWMIYQLPLLGS